MIVGNLALRGGVHAQQLADQVGVGRASVIRTAQTLGYEGYPQLRVALARDSSSPSRSQAPTDDGTAVGTLQGALEEFGRSLPRVTAALTEEALVAFVTALDEADRVVISANGLSAPLGLDAAMRLGAAGRPAEYLPETMAQQIAARQLSPQSVCLLISGSGVNLSTPAVAGAAREAGARLLALTSFSSTPPSLSPALSWSSRRSPTPSATSSSSILHAPRSPSSSSSSVALLVERLVGTERPTPTPPCSRFSDSASTTSLVAEEPHGGLPFPGGFTVMPISGRPVKNGVAPTACLEHFSDGCSRRAHMSTDAE